MLTICTIIPQRVRKKSATPITTLHNNSAWDTTCERADGDSTSKASGASKPSSPDSVDSDGIGNDSNDSWGLDAVMATKPRMVAIVQGFKKSNIVSVLSYHGSLELVDSQEIFSATFHDPM